MYLPKQTQKKMPENQNIVIKSNTCGHSDAHAH